MFAQEDSTLASDEFLIYEHVNVTYASGISIKFVRINRLWCIPGSYCFLFTIRQFSQAEFTINPRQIESLCPMFDPFICNQQFKFEVISGDYSWSPCVSNDN